MSSEELESENLPPRSPRQRASRINPLTEALSQAHVALLERELVTRSNLPNLYRLINNQYAALQNWHDRHTEWRIRRTSGVIRLVRAPSTFIPGYVFNTLQKPRDFACFCWTLWYAESRQQAGRGNEQQFLMSQLAERLEEQSGGGKLAPHVAALDFRKQDDRYSLQRALKILHTLGALQLQDGSTEDWVNKSGQEDALWEFTEVTRSLISAFDLIKVQAAGQVLDGNPQLLQPTRLPGAEQLEPKVRAWRALLLGPQLLRYDDPAAFAALEEHAAYFRSELGEIFGWQLDLRREYASIMRASGSAASPVMLLNLQAAVDQAALLCCDAIRQKVAAGEWRPDQRGLAQEGCIFIAEGEVAQLLLQVRERDGDRWGSTARQTGFEMLKREIYAKMRQAGFMRGPDRNGYVLILPAAARFAVGYSREDEEEVTPEVAPPAEQLNFGENLNGDEVKGYNTVQASRILNVSDVTILSWIKAGRLKAERSGRVWLIPVAEVERLKKK